MKAVLNHISTHMEDKFYWPAPSTHGKSTDYLAVSDKIEELWARYLRLCDVEPLPQYKLDEIVDDQQLEGKEIYTADQMAMDRERPILTGNEQIKEYSMIPDRSQQRDMQDSRHDPVCPNCGSDWVVQNVEIGERGLSPVERAYTCLYCRKSFRIDPMADDDEIPF